MSQSAAELLVVRRGNGAGDVSGVWPESVWTAGVCFTAAQTVAKKGI